MSATMLSLLGWVLDTTVKGSVVIVLVLVTQAIVGRYIGARWRHALWLLVLLRLALPLAPSTPWSVFNLFPGEPRIGLPLRVAAAQIPVRATFGDTPTEVVNLLGKQESGAMWRWILAVWLFGALALGLRSIIAAIRVQMAVRRADEDATPQPRLLEIVEQAKRRLGVKRSVRVVECDLVDAPALHGLIHPVLLVPNGFCDAFDRDELWHVALHELWHLRRFDVAVNWALAAVESFHWFNPLVWFAVSRIREERELACDELALSCLELDERLGYGRTILKLLERFRAATPIPAFVGIVNHKQLMKRRLLMITSYRNRNRFSVLFLATLALVGLVGMTDAATSEKRVWREKLDPAAMETVQKLGQRLTLDITNASLGEVLAAVSNATGVTMAQSPGTATSSAQQARFTLHAENIPAEALLRGALMPLHLFPKPDANGVTVFAIVSPEAAEASGKTRTFQEEQHVVIGPDATAGSAGERKKVTITMDGDNDTTVQPGGTLHRTMKLNIDENGVKTTGTLTIDITGLPASPASK
jgi:beta-lactamase regulating signal transducer with metallopeptidase domain